MNPAHDEHMAQRVPVGASAAQRRDAMRAELQEMLVADERRRRAMRQRAALACGTAMVALLAATPLVMQSASQRSAQSTMSGAGDHAAASVEAGAPRVRIVEDATRERRVRTVVDGGETPRIVVAREDGDVEGRLVVEGGHAFRHVRIVEDSASRLVMIEADDELLLALRRAGVPAALVGDSGARAGNLVFLDPGLVVDAGGERR